MLSKLRILTPTIHGLLDYAAAAALIVLPFILNLGADSPLALWLSAAGGAGLIVYSLLTDYAFGAIKVVPFKIHLVIDLTAAAAFVVAPFAFGWSGLTAVYYFVMGAGVIVVVALSQVEGQLPAPRVA